ncbi:MAG: DNA ligase, partial [Gemmatimonadetes bacterium]|nr:DNA ligase [Gemmatimonadota bacterium]
DPKGWWASEKYDGLRALWDGENFYSRNGKIFHAPQWFKDTLPSTPLDGELWGERSVAGFQKAVSAVRKKVGGKEWENITYMVFDIPTSKEPFEKVQAKLKRMDLGPYGAVAPQYKVKSKSDMLRHFDRAVREGAEGIMLRKPGSKYAATRSSSLLKVKPTDSSEAVVTGYQAGTGKHRGRMGALHVYLLGDKSKKFKIGTGFSDRERESPPPVGSIVEFKFNDKTARGIPRFPAFLRIRTDMMADRPKRKATKSKGKRVLFSGSRHWDRVAPVRAVISSIPRGSTAIHGGAKGLDSLAGRLAQEKGLAVEVYEADWSRGRKAGPERNQEMVDAGADIVYAFPVEGSRGTWDLVKRARKAGIPVQVYGEDFGTTKRKATKPARKKTMAKKKDREGLLDPKHYWARRVKKKYKYSRGSGSGQYPAKVGDWELDETWYDATLDGNAAYETESASFEHPANLLLSIYHRSGPKGETWDLDYESYPTLRAALAALKRTEGLYPLSDHAAPKKRKAAPKRKT